MFKVFLRIFGSGRLPKEAQRVVEAEHGQVLLEGVLGWITFRNFRAPGRRAALRRQWFLGAVAVTKKRLLVYRYGSCLLDIRFDDPRFKSLDYSAEAEGTLTFAHNASLLGPNASGEIEICYRTADAVRICAELGSHGHKGHAVLSRRAPSR